MKLTHRSQVPALTALFFALNTLGCSSDSSEGVTEADVVKNYAAIVSASYTDSLTTVEALHEAVHAFTEAPSEATLTAAKKAWLASRNPYGETEAYRFYQGPIDNDDSDDDVPEGPEGLINSWPLDESYIDYVTDQDGKVVETDADGNPLKSIINSVEEYPKIDAATLAEANTATGETSVSTGYHAIEFLLWGQDHSDTGPGDRPYTDYVSGPEGTAENQGRRAQYLLTVTDLLEEDLTTVNAAWLDKKANYRADFLALPPRVALGKIMLGMGTLAGGELSHERMQVAFDDRDQENEHSCFSDNTLADLHNNAVSVQNVLLGHYGDIEGPGIDDLVEAKDPALATKLRVQIQDAIDNIDAVEGPFDAAILKGDDSEDREHLRAAIDALKAFSETVIEAGQAIGVDVKFEE